MKRISALDGIRGLAILLVICWHYLTMEIRAPLPSPYTLAGFFYGLSCSTWCGVDLFFVLSGYLIGGILLDNRDSENFLRVFYRRRICRIFPLYFGWLAICVIICKTALIKVHVLAQIFYPETQFTYYFFYLQNLAGQMAAGKMPVSLAVTWSLAVEEQFYMVKLEKRLNIEPASGALVWGFSSHYPRLLPDIRDAALVKHNVR